MSFCDGFSWISKNEQYYREKSLIDEEFNNKKKSLSPSASVVSIEKERTEKLNNLYRKYFQNKPNSRIPME